MQLSLPEGLRNPAAVIAFSGWNDAGNAASDAVMHLVESYPSKEFARIDNEKYYDFISTRPHLKRAADGPWIEWPQLSLYHVEHPQRDLIAVVGPEPSMLWRSFANELITLLDQVHPVMCVLLGAMLSDTPHSRPLPVAMATLNRDLRHRLHLEPLRYEGPIGIVGVINQMLVARGFATASMWVSIPHYVSTPPSPKGQYALLSKVAELLDVEVEHSDLPEAAEEWTKAVEELKNEDPDVAEYIEQLEEARDASDVEEATGEAIAAEFERYLNRQDDD